jgi:hypothetical protein
MINSRWGHPTGTLKVECPHSLVVAIAAAIAIAGLTVSVGAFGDSGHRTIGRVAEMHLGTSRALAEVKKILRPNETLADAAVWPDVIKNPLYEDEDTGPFRLEHPAHDTYHYANLPFQSDRYQLTVPGARPGDIVQTLGECIRVLRGQSTVFTPREALRLLAHLAGDIHQPLHVGNAFVSARVPLAFIVPKGPTGWRTTIGGNALVYGPEDRFNLHSYWDSHGVNLAMGKDDLQAFAARIFAVPVDRRWNGSGDPSTWPEQWANDALVFAKDVHEEIAIVAYIGPDDARRTPHRWRITQAPSYDDLARKRLPLQLAAAGYRLAATLNAIWPE